MDFRKSLLLGFLLLGLMQSGKQWAEIFSTIVSCYLSFPNILIDFSVCCALQIAAKIIFCFYEMFVLRIYLGAITVCL